MARIRAKVTLPWTSNLPEDVTVNTFHFLTASSPSTPTERSEILARLAEFYNVSSGVAGNQLSGYLGNLISRSADACTIDLYDIDDAPPRQPISTGTFTLGASDSAQTTATEVALCVSFQAAPISGVPQSRRRGRIYLGPFIEDILDENGRPEPVLVASAAAAGNLLLDSLQGANPVRWTVYSRVGDAMAEVVNGWVDDEWDTMRSRGRRATGRTTFAI